MVSHCKRAVRAIGRAVQGCSPRVADGLRGNARCELLEARQLLSDASTAVQLFDARPAVFVQNQGQWADGSVYYAYTSGNASIAFGNDGLRFHLTQSVAAAADATGPGGGLAEERVPVATESTSLSMQFVGANRVTPQGEQKAEGVYNYFIGDQANWRSNVSGYQTVSYDNLYAGVTLKTFGQQGSMKYEFHVAPGADYQQVRIHYDGIQGLSIANDGSLHVQTALGEMVDDAPVIYQEIAGQRVEVAGRFVLVDDSSYAFEVTGQWDARHELVLDPELTWSSYLGGSGYEKGSGIAIDGSGNAWVTGSTLSSDFASGGFDTSHNGAYYDAFVAKINANGTLAWSSYLGGSGDDYGTGIAVDGSGNAWVTGSTLSSDFASGGFGTSYNGGYYDAFVAKINANGTLAWSSYLGGSFGDYGNGIAIDGSGNAWVTGSTSSSGWASGGFDTTYNGGYDDTFVAKINANGTLAWSSYLGGSGEDEGNSIAVDGSGNAWVTGQTASSGWAIGGFDTSYNRGVYDAFVAKINANGTLAWSSYLGGSFGDYGNGIAIDGSGNAWVTGSTTSSDFASGGFNTSYHGGNDAFVAKVNADGTLAWSSYLGGASEDDGNGITVDGSGNAWVTGQTGASGWAIGGFDTSYNGGYYDAFVAKINANGTLAWSSYLGGSGDDRGNSIAVDGSGNAWVTGSTDSSGFASGGFNTSYNGVTDAFVAKISAANRAATVSSLNKSVSLKAWLAFAAIDFASVFSNPDYGGSLAKIRITSLPALGTLKLGGAMVALNQEIAASQLGTLTYTSLSIGIDSFGWNGSDGSLYAATGATVNVTVTKATATSVTTYSSNPDIHLGEVLSVTVLVTVPEAFGTLPTGRITLRDRDGTVLQRVRLVNGQATCSLAGLKRGYHEIGATYSGDALYETLTAARALPVNVVAGNVVDILAVYTPEASQTVIGQGLSIRDVIYKAVADANDALMNSQINLSLRLVDVALINYNESGTYSTDLTRLRTPGDGYLDEISSLRDAYGADLVSLFVGGMQSNRTVGLGYVMNNADSVQNEQWGFTEVWVNEAGGPYYAMAHELGHNFGAVHDREHMDGKGVYDTSYGYRYQGADGVYYHDIMSYDSASSDVLIPYYSNPNVSYAGKPTGQAGYSDVAWTINATAPAVANYRPTAVPGVTATQTQVLPMPTGTIYSNLPVKLRARVVGLSANPNTPEGTVTFLDGNALLGTGALSNGKAIWTGLLSEGGAHSIRALYQNDDYFGDSLSAPVLLTATGLTIAEHAAAGTAVGSAAGTAGPDHTLTYAITAGNVGGAFAIDASTGTIVVADSVDLDYEQKRSFTLNITATDNSSPGTAGAADVTVNLIDVNEAPTDVMLSRATVADRRPAGTVVGRLHGIDPDAGDVLSYEVAGPDKAFFTLDGNVLKTAASFKYEIKNSYSIRVGVIDKGGLRFMKDMTVNVTDSNRAPTSLSILGKRIAENMPAGTVVGGFSSVDPDIANTFTYTLADGGVDNAAFKISANGRLKTKRAFDFETKSSYSILVRSMDQGGLFCEQAITVKVTDVNEAPTGVAMTNSSVLEHKPAGTLVGKLIGTDPDAGNTLTYALISGAGDNAMFYILNGKLRTADRFDYATHSVYKVRVRVMDQGGLWFDQAMRVGVTR